MPAKESEPVSFEKSLARLEKIVEEMEKGNLSLDNMIARFEEGQALMKDCRKKLNEVQKKVELLVKKDGALSTEKFVEDASDASEEEEDSLF